MLKSAGQKHFKVTFASETAQIVQFLRKSLICNILVLDD